MLLRLTGRGFTAGQIHDETSPPVIAPPYGSILQTFNVLVSVPATTVEFLAN
jgi:hypothetical protein